MLRVSTMSDFPDWLKLAEEVEPLFGPMIDDPTFCDGLKQVILEGNAFCFAESQLSRVPRGKRAERFSTYPTVECREVE